MASPISSDNHYSPSYGNRGPLILGISWTEFAIATALVGLRIGYAFSKRISKAGSSLYWTCGSWVSYSPSQYVDPLSSYTLIGFWDDCPSISHHICSLRYRKSRFYSSREWRPYHCSDVGLDRSNVCAVCDWSGQSGCCCLLALSAGSNL